MSSPVSRQSMNWRPLVWCACALVLLVSSARMLVGGRDCSGLSIDSINAYFYYHATSTFGEENLASGKLALRNSIIGEGDAEHPSSTTLVMVSLDTCASWPSDAVLEFSAAEAGGKTMTESTVPLSSYFSQGNRVTIPFLLYGTGCESVELKATVVGPGDARRESTAVLPFICGE